MTHPTPTHPGPSGPPAPAPPPRTDGTAVPLPRLGEVIRDAEHLGARMLAVLCRDVDPDSEPTVAAFPGLTDEILAHRVLLADAQLSIRSALWRLAQLAALPLPPVGSAVKTTRLVPGDEPTPGSAAVHGGAARESTGGVISAPGAGESSGPSPRGGRRGAGPTYLGAT